MNGNKVYLDPSAPIEWDRSQKDVIGSPPGDRLLVGAGPGTGKTAVACARVSRLIKHSDLEPSRIWLISFTRTAVREIRDRIAAYLEDAGAAYAVKIATLDSHAWTIHSGFDEDAKILGYEENIESMLELVRQNANVAEYLESIEHLIVDEAQDIVGSRADLVIEIIRKLSSECGVSIFADEAQAIYGFADDKEVKVGQVREPPLPGKIRLDTAVRFRECELTEVHRTTSPQLLTIFSDTRRKVLTAAGETDNKLVEIRKDICRLAHGKVPCIKDAALAEMDDVFILYRKRCDVLLTSSILTEDSIPHRIRMSGLPVCLAPWIGAALSEHTAPDLSRDTFMELWATRVHNTSLASLESDNAWEHLVRIAGRGRTRTVVGMRQLRERLGRKQPPAELCHAEFGTRGPIVGTIHASKGREADTVCLMLSTTDGRNIDQDEESRVVFVGATRGRKRLLIDRVGWHSAARVEATGRAYRLLIKDKKPLAQVEIGHDNDIEAEGLAGRRFFANPDAVRDSQKWIRDHANKIMSLTAIRNPNLGFAYRLKKYAGEPCEPYFAVLSLDQFNRDLFSIANVVQAKLGKNRLFPPPVINDLYVRGVHTIVLPPDASENEKLHEPWGSSGILLAPLVLGYSRVWFH